MTPVIIPGDSKKIMALDPSTLEVERILAGAVSYSMYLEHMARYVFSAQFAKKRSVLDVACGTGFGSYFLQRTCHSNVAGLDISRDAVQFARAQYKSERLSFCLGDATRLPFQAAAFDLVTSFETIEHVSDPNGLLSEYKRVLKDGSTLIISTPNRTVHEKQGIRVPYHLQEFYLQEFQSLVSGHFRIMGIFGQLPLKPDQLKPARAGRSALQRISGYLPRRLRKLAVPFYESCLAKTPILPTIRYYLKGLSRDSVLNNLDISGRYDVVPVDRIQPGETSKTYVIVAES